MTASQVRSQAREKLAGKWGKAALLMLVFTVLVYIIAFLLNLVPVVGYFTYLLISVPLSYGFTISMIRFNDNEEVTNTEFFNNGFSNFGKAWKISLWTIVKLILPVILVIISAVIVSVGTIGGNKTLETLGLILYIVSIIYTAIKQFSYSLAIFVSYDNPEMTAKETVNKSAELMKGKVWSLFCLNLSFIGWAILAIFTLGIGIFWLSPYMNLSTINFYRNLTGEVSSAE